MRQSVGIMKNRSHLLFKYKEDQKSQVNRFRKPQEMKLPNSSSISSQSQETDTQLLDRKNSSGESTATNQSIEMRATQSGLQAEWGVYFEECNDRIKQIQDIIRDLQQLGTKRLKMQFGDATQLERQIYEANQKATTKIMECEKYTELITKYSNECETQSDMKIRLNINRALAQQISDLTNQLRNQQKRMVTMIKQIQKDDAGDFLKLSQQKEQEMKVAANELTQVEEQMYDDVVVERDQEINKLVTMINELAEVFKSLNQLVLDQGTILDRIDYNIDQTLHNVQKANVQLKKAEEIQNSPLARRCIITLVALIAICSILLTIKYSN